MCSTATALTGLPSALHCHCTAPFLSGGSSQFPPKPWCSAVQLIRDYTELPSHYQTLLSEYYSSKTFSTD